MFAYCGNNPVVRVDPSGDSYTEVAEFATSVFTEIAYVIKSMASAYTGCAAATFADGPLPVADTIAAVGMIALTIGATGVGVYNAIKAIPTLDTSAQENIKEGTQDIARSENGKVLITFPVDPNNFRPVGLERVDRPGTKNGALISWMDPLLNVEVFRWDENINNFNGPHYHIYGQGHYYPGIDTVPEPYASIYFPLIGG